jgi:hypothetical protein
MVFLLSTLYVKWEDKKGRQAQKHYKGMGFLIKGMPEFQRRKTGFFLKQFTERLGMFKAQFVGNLTNRQVCSGKFFLCFFY